MIQQEYVAGDPVSTLVLYNSIWPLPGMEGEFLVSIKPDETRCWQDSARFAGEFWPPQAVTGPCTGGCCHPGTFQGRPSSQLLVWWSGASSSPFPSLFTERSPQTNLAVREQAAFHCAAGGACMVFSIERSFPSVEERLGSSCFGASALRGMSL